MFLTDLLFPKICLGCGYLGAYVCPKCQKKLRYVENDICPYCQRSSFFGLTHPDCRKTSGLDGAVSIFYYNDFLKTIIKNIKYRLATTVWHDFCQVIKPERLKKILVYRQLSAELFLQPVPLHPDRLKSRGFNQAQIITLFFEKYLHYPQTDLLIRKKPTASQAQLTAGNQRYRNICGAFKATHRTIDGKEIILVDDILTTGSTVKEAAYILKKAGAKRVYALVIAKG